MFAQTIRTSRIMIVALTMLAMLSPRAGKAQETAKPAPAKLAVFFRGWTGADTTSLVRKVGFVSLVTDSSAADVLVTISREPEGRFTLIFHGARVLPSRGDTLLTPSSADTAAAANLMAVAKTLELGLLPYVAKSPAAPAVDVTYEAIGSGGVVRTTQDPWRRWILNAGVTGTVSGQQHTGASDLAFTAGANRTTEGARIETAATKDRAESHYDIGEQHLKSSNRADAASITAVKRLNSHWGAGGTLDYSSSTLLNEKRVFNGSPMLEYSVFPYDEFAQRSLFLQYSIGVDRLEYYAETIYDKMQETQPKHSLGAAFTNNAEWGLISISVVESEYLKDRNKRNLATNVSSNVQLFRGLGLMSGVNYTMIHDQLYLEKTGGSVEDVLLKRRQLATSYKYSIYFGLNYSFGSKGLIVPNPRIMTAGK